MPDVPDKEALRAKMRAMRRAVSPSVRLAASAAVCRQLLARADVRRCLARKATVCVYMASSSELDLARFMTAVLEAGCRLVAPRWTGSAYDLAVLPGTVVFADYALLERGPMGILQPSARAERVDAAEVGLWIVPGLAFASDGARLGYGGGWYDRFLKTRAADSAVLGVAYAFQCVETLPVEAHDARVADVVVCGRRPARTEMPRVAAEASAAEGAKTAPAAERTDGRGAALPPEPVTFPQERESEDTPVPVLEERNGYFFAGWSSDDARMRTAGRSVLEATERPHTPDEVFANALRSTNAEVAWPDAAALRDLRLRVAARTAPVRVDRAARAAVSFRLEAPASAEAGWTLAYRLKKRTVATLRALGQACATYPALRGAFDGRVALATADLERFLHGGAAALRTAGYTVELPERFAAADVTATAQIVPAASGVATPQKPLARKLTIHVDGEVVTREEIVFMLEQGGCTVFFRGRWIEVDRFVLKNALKALDEAAPPISEREALSWAFGFRRPRGLNVTDVHGTGSFGDLLRDLRKGDAFHARMPPKGFHGTLRAYQKRGWAWLAYLSDRGFGPLLADDMGLGKTVQTIAWLLSVRAKKGPPALIVAPVSVTMNWVREFARFAPKWKILLHRGKERLRGSSFVAAVAEYDAVVTGYPALTRDFAFLAQANFSAFVLDEAQKIKNPDTALARAARAFPCDRRAALTGTPFENSALDLWSIEEFLNPGIFGRRSEFERDYVQPMRADAKSPAAMKLRRQMQPFLLRRLKTDPHIASELGAKREVREYVALDAEQRARYETALARHAHVDGSRRGDALALLTELKFVCDGFERNGKRLSGGKAERLDELVADIFANGESCLVFTQYVQIAKLLVARLADAYGSDAVQCLHGEMSAEAREAAIAAFNAGTKPHVFVLSLKAGGFGLNLVRATHVIHYDRWWNPAVENQATDRAHRIGQTGTVFVHLLIAAGSLEDHIDALLESKRTRAGEVITSGEGYLLGLGRAAFGKVVSLS